MTDLISYEELRRVQNIEKDNNSLQQVDRDFFLKVKSYVQNKKTLVKENLNSDNAFSKQTYEKAMQELINIEKILADLCSRRQRKMVMHALTNLNARVHSTENMLPEEEYVYNQVVSLLKKNKEEFMKKFEEVVVKVELQKNELPLKLLRITEEVPSFAWTDGNNYGAFVKEDIVNLPVEVAEFLITQEKAIEVKVSETKTL